MSNRFSLNRSFGPLLNTVIVSEAGKPPSAKANWCSWNQDHKTEGLTNCGSVQYFNTSLLNTCQYNNSKSHDREYKVISPFMQNSINQLKHLIATHVM